MGYILTPIAVDLKQVTGVIGSKNKRLLSTLIKEFGGEFEQIDEMAADFVDEMDEEDGATTVRDALTQMVMGQEYNEELGFVYGYALEFVCRHFGEYLPNGNWSAMRSEWAHKADKALEKAGVGAEALRLSRLMNRGAPVPLPLIEDFPGIGYMTRKEIDAALLAFGADQLVAVKDAAVREALAEVRGWLQTCAASKRDLICFYA
jgi:hypothetical protein